MEINGRCSNGHCWAGLDLSPAYANLSFGVETDISTPSTVLLLAWSLRPFLGFDWAVMVCGWLDTAPNGLDQD